MRVLLLGSGGREHALAAALAADPAVTALHCAPGNPGIGRLAALHPADLTDVAAPASRAVEVAPPEVSLFVVTDGITARPLLPVQDFKRIGDGDTGPNTGGMGAYAPLPWLPPSFVDGVSTTVVQPTLARMRDLGAPFAGLLYVG